MILNLGRIQVNTELDLYDSALESHPHHFEK